MARNSATQRFGIAGVEELSAVLKALPDEIRDEVLPTVVAAGGRVVQEGAKFLAPVRDGHLQASISVLVRKYPAQHTAVAVIGPANDYRSPKGDRPAKYAHLVEFGHMAVAPRKGTTRRESTAQDVAFVAARPFMRPAVQTAAGFALRPMAEAAERGLERAADKLVRRYGHKQSS